MLFPKNIFCSQPNKLKIVAYNKNVISQKYFLFSTQYKKQKYLKTKYIIRLEFFMMFISFLKMHP